MPPVEQIKAKRAGVGLRACDHDRAFPGFTLFAPQSGGGKVYLIDIDGNVAHTWQMPYPPGNSGYLTERGTYFYNGKTIEQSDRFISRQPWKGGVVLEADWNGRVLWEVRQPDHHHDGIRLRNGNVLLICLAQLPQHFVSQVKGGRPGTEHNGEMYADYLVEMTTDGRVVWDWRTWEHLDPETDCITAVQDLREAWTHANGLAEMPNGDIVVSFRNISTVIIIDRKTGEIIWKLGAPPLSGPACADAAAERQLAAVRQRSAPVRSYDAFFAHYRSRFGNQADRLEVSGEAGIRILQPADFQRSAIAQWQHAGLRRRLRPLLRGHLRR